MRVISNVWYNRKCHKLTPFTHSKCKFSPQVNGTSDLFGTDYVDPRSGGIRYRHYYIAAEEITWDYGVRKPHQLIKAR